MSDNDTPMCPGCEMGVVDDPYREPDGTVWHGECFAEECMCPGCGCVGECVCPTPTPYTDAYLPGDRPKASTHG